MVQGQLSLHQKLSTTAKNVLVLPALKSLLLISLGQLYDDNCKIELDKRELKVLKNKQLMLKGNRNYQDGLWDIPITKHSIIDDNYYSILDQWSHDDTSMKVDNMTSCYNTLIDTNTNSS